MCTLQKSKADSEISHSPCDNLCTYCFKFWTGDITKSRRHHITAKIPTSLLVPSVTWDEAENKLNHSCLKFKIYHQTQSKFGN